MNHKPATALPFKVIEQRGSRPSIYINGAEHAGSIAKMYNRMNWQDDSAYIAHSANAYQKLVEFASYVASQDPNGMTAEGNTARALLREIGEAS